MPKPSIPSSIYLYRSINLHYQPEKNGNKYNKDLEMEIHSVIKPDMHEQGKHARCRNVSKNKLSPIAERMKKAAKGKNRAVDNMEKRH